MFFACLQFSAQLYRFLCLYLFIFLIKQKSIAEAHAISLQTFPVFSAFVTETIRSDVYDQMVM